MRPHNFGRSVKPGRLCKINQILVAAVQKANSTCCIVIYFAHFDKSAGKSSSRCLRGALVVLFVGTVLRVAVFIVRSMVVDFVGCEPFDKNFYHQGVPEKVQEL